jgi:DNA (cytosine-5)-methyltransferase 3A
MNYKKKGASGLDGIKSGLFFHALRILKKTKPAFWLMENVASMRRADRQTITDLLGVEPILINSNLLTGQNRRRLYWCNWTVTQPEDRAVRFNDILQPVADIEPRYWLQPKSYKFMDYTFKDGKTRWERSWHNDSDREKASCLLATCSQGSSSIMIDRRTGERRIRKLTPIEIERLQGLPDNYTQSARHRKRYEMIGNGFTIPVIAHILQCNPAFCTTNTNPHNPI